MIIILADLGNLRAFRVKANVNQTDVTPVLEEMTVAQATEPPQRLSDTVSDQAGRFRSDGSPGMARGEAHGLATEQDRRQVVEIAGAVNQLVAENSSSGAWALAAPKSINAKLLEALDTKVRDGLRENLKIDLCKQPVLEIQKRFKLPSVV